MGNGFIKSAFADYLKSILRHDWIKRMVIRLSEMGDSGGLFGAEEMTNFEKRW